MNEVFLFRDAAELRTSQTMHYHNGVYQNTTYTHTWTDVGGRKRYTISGSYNKKVGFPPSTDYFHYARAAEFAWTFYLLEQTFHQLELSGGVTFHLGGNQWIRLGPGKPQPTPARGASRRIGRRRRVGAAVVEKGVEVHASSGFDAQEGWFSSTGVIKFSFDTLANAQLFFHLLDKLIGVQTQ